MTDIKKLLSVGDLRSAGHSEKVVKMVLAEPALFNDLVNTIFCEHPATKMRACDAIEKITRKHPQYLAPHKKTFLDRVAAMEQKEVRWHCAQILPRLNLTAKEKEKVHTLMMGYLKDKSSIVKTFAMQALVDLATQDSSHLNSTRKLIHTLSQTGTPAMQSRGRKLLKQLDDV